MRTFLLVPVAIALSGCVHWVVFGHSFDKESAAQQASAELPPAKPPVQPARAVSRSMLQGVSLTLTLAAREKADPDQRISRDALVAALKGELRARKLLAEGGLKAERSMTVVINDFTTRPSSNAVIFGYVISEGFLTGDVHVSATSGEPLQAFRIKAQSRLVTPAAAQDNPPLDSLYARFANLTVDGLSGAPRRPEDLTNSEAPR
jgi:hypothetical protein